MDFLSPAFSALSLFDQFIIYTNVPSKTRVGKTDKFPINYRTGNIVNAHDPEIWLDAQTAINEAKRRSNHGVGFVITDKDPFWFLDIDDCLNPDGLNWSPVALSLLSSFNGAAVEVSSSGKGLHIIGSGMCPQHGCRNREQKLEFYTEGRFVALTGNQAVGDAGLDCTPIVHWLVQQYFTPQNTPINSPWTDEPCLGWRWPSDDNDLINRALRSQSGRAAFGNGVQFRDLWDANVEALAKAYPDNNRTLGYNESSADASLAQHLAFWTGNDCERIRRLMWQSKLKREKWDREDYLPRTILGVCGRQSQWLSDKEPEAIASAPIGQGKKPRQQPVNGSTFLTLDQQRDLFEGCVFIKQENKVLIPGGYVYGRETFSSIYAGYTMQMDNMNQKVTDDAWRAYIHSKALRPPTVDLICFDPSRPSADIIQKDDGETTVNTYWEINIPKIKGDPTPFLNHLAKLCPNPRDAIILLSYFAAIVQHKGVKFQWCPLIQGVPGNGKTLLSDCITFAVGQRYSHSPKSAEIVSKFNDWLYGKIFITVEDIYVPESRLEVMEALKPMITGSRQEIEPKGGVKLTKDICANFILNTNHKDGLRKIRDDRRFAPFYTAQQHVEDLERDGLTSNYFYNLWRWLKTGGFAIVAEFLHSYPILDEFNPARESIRAAHTSSTEDAIKEGLGSIEQEIVEAVEQGIVGFRGGWISSMQLNNFLERIGAARRLSQKKRQEVLKSLGYVRHPGLIEGRASTEITPDNGKPRLYIKNDHPDIKIKELFSICKAYSDAQK